MGWKDIYGMEGYAKIWRKGARVKRKVESVDAEKGREKGELKDAHFRNAAFYIRDENKSAEKWFTNNL